MRTLLVVMLAACGAKASPVAEGPPAPLPPDNTVAASSGVAVNPDCVPGGTYKVLWDFEPAKIVGAGIGDAACRAMVESLATQGLGEMKISHAGALVVTWPGAQTVIERGLCAFEITSRSPALAMIKFSGGTGNGIASFSITASGGAARPASETQDKPGERCDLEGAAFMLAKQP